MAIGSKGQVTDTIYPAGWPRCPNCGEHALDGHITCGKAECNEGWWRRAKVDLWRARHDAED